MNINLKCRLISDVGCVRANNEDMVLMNGELYRDQEAEQSYTLEGDARFTTLVADGMGGTNGGEFASELALQYFDQFLARVPEGLSDEDFHELIDRWAKQTHQGIVSRGIEQTEYSNMGTTLTGLFGYGGRIYLINIGDSRTYRFRGGVLKRLSRDHSMQEKYHDYSLPSNMIYNCLGGGAPVEEVFADLTDITDQVMSEDRFIICSDGLHDMIDDDTIERIVDESLNSEEVERQDTVKELVEAAKKAGGKDNVSVLLVHFVSVE
ncbi:MAG: protein phosphatase 2C domain-containing protein [Bacteroidaceae bacterium]|nr:protein phosphatase 2C domain-containing protein [Bacteroidaceae bacterium]